MQKLIENKKARLEYEVLETFEAGIELFGFEVKSVRGKLGKLVGAHATVRGGEVFLINADIPAVQPANAPENFDSKRNRRLLLNKKEIKELAHYEEKPGLTLIPLSMYNKNSRIKVELGVVKGRKQYDKRNKIKEKDTVRDMERDIKGVMR